MFVADSNVGGLFTGLFVVVSLFNPIIFYQHCALILKNTNCIDGLISNGFVSCVDSVATSALYN